LFAHKKVTLHFDFVLLLIKKQIQKNNENYIND